MRLLISTIICLTIVSVSTENEASCDGLDLLVQNTNPDLLHRCVVDTEDCIFVNCRGNGILSNFFSSISFRVERCFGLEVNLIEANGMTAFKEIVTTPTVITRSFNTVTVSISVQVNMTITSASISVDPVIISSPENGVTSAPLVGPTSISIDQTGCRSRPSPGTMTATPTPSNGPSTTLIATLTTTTVQPQILVPNAATCAGFQRLAKNVNPLLLSDCAQDSACTLITCQAMGQLSIEIDAFSISLDICKEDTPPGVVIELLKNGSAVFYQRITRSTKINYSKVGTATVEASIILNNTNTSIGIAVDPVTVSKQSFIGAGSNLLSATLLNYTQVPFNTSYCYIGLRTDHNSNSGNSGESPVVTVTIELILVALVLTVLLSLVQLDIYRLLYLFM